MDQDHEKGHEKKIRRLEDHVGQYRIRIKDSSELKLEQEVFDTPTLKALYGLASKNMITAMGGAISSGKEAIVFHAIGENGKELAVKIYRINNSDFQKMQDYLIGDPRFSNVKPQKKAIVFAWTKKEQRNLEKAAEAGVRVPQPIVSDRNILIMEFIGKDGVPAPRLRDIGLEDPERIYKIIAHDMALLYQKAKLVHADLSEFNILLYDNEPIVIDMGQAVMLDHPMSHEFLTRDIKNIVRYFKKMGVDCTEEKLKAEIIKRN
jgi:RIO kinase 1